MGKLTFLLLLASTCFADTIVSGSSTYATNILPYNSDTSFTLTLSGGQFSSLSVFHFFQQGAKGSSNQDFTTSFSFPPVPAIAIGVIGIQTPFSVVLSGVDYAQGYSVASGSVVPPDGSIFSGNITLTPLSGTNVIDTTQDSTATGLFSLNGLVSATINGVTATDTFSGYASFYGTYLLHGNTPFLNAPQLTETYTFSATPVPEPAASFELLSGLGLLGLAGIFRRP